jgi:hypothetical protein
MTTSDLIAEALRNFRDEFRAELRAEVKRIVREEIRSSKYAVTPKGGGAEPTIRDLLARRAKTH